MRTVSLANYEPATDDFPACGDCGGTVVSVRGPDVYAVSDTGVHSVWAIVREHEPWCELALLYTNRDES